MDFGIITNLNSYVKSTLTNPLNKMKEEQSSPIIQQLNTEPEGGSDGRLSAIILKMQSGEELTAGELEYLKEHSPDAYNAAIKAAREKQAYENELRRCKTKDEVRLLHMAKISPLFNKANNAKAHNDLTTAQTALAEASVLTAIFTKFTATRDYAKKAPDRASLEKAIQAEKDKYVKEDKNMSVTPINKIPSHYATRDVNKQDRSRTIGNGRPMNLMMEVGDAEKFKGVTEADTPEHMRPKILDLVRREFVENYGAPSDSNAYRDLIYDYARSFSDDADIKKEVHAMYSLNLAEKDRLQKLAEENFPGWKPGKPFDKDAMWALISVSFDIKV